MGPIGACGQDCESGRRRRALVLLGVAVLVAALLGACGSSGSDDDQAGAGDGPGQIVTSAQAVRIVGQYADGANRANSVLDVPLLDRLESGPAGAIDRAFLTRLKNEGQSSTGGTFRLDDVSVYVPAQTAYPANFLARYTVVPSGGPPSRQVGLFVKNGPDDPWRMEFFAGVLPSSGFPPLKSAGGHAELVVPEAAGTLGLDPERLGPELAAYLGGGEEALARSTVFAAGPEVTELVRNQAMTTAGAAARNLTLSYEVTATDDPVYSYRTQDGGALSLVTVEVAERLRQNQPGAVFHQGPERKEFGGLVPPGDHPELDTRYLLLAGVVVPPAGSGVRAEIAMLYRGIAAITPVPARG